MQEKYKGMRVFTPQDYTNLEQITDIWVKVAKRYGFLQYKTSILDPIEIYKDKTSEEILKEQTYSFKDRGGRDVVIRPEITPGLAKMMVGMGREIKYPYKVFSIGSVFRYETEQRGRKREHIQFNADIFGTKSLWSESEVINLAVETLIELGVKEKDIEIRLNDRDHMENIIEGSKEIKRKVFRLLDKRSKISKQELENELSIIDSNLSLNEIDKKLKTSPETIDSLKKAVTKGKVIYDSSIIRGFDYYTGIVFEIYVKGYERSIAGGGRYDNLIESYGGEKTSAVGFGMGDTSLLEMLPKTNQKKAIETVFLITEDVKYEQKALSLADNLRNKVNVSYLGTPKKVSDIYKRAENEGIEKVIVLSNNTIIRNIKTKKDKEVDIKDIQKSL